MIFDIEGVQSKIGYAFRDVMLLRKCFTHSSYAYEHGGDDNELLEFFGDAIIEFVTTEYLFKNASGDEGKLTEERKELVSKEPLLRSVKKLGLTDYVLLGKGIDRTHTDEKLFSSVYESLVAGIYIDGGLKEAKRFIADTIIKDYEADKKKKEKKKPNADYKSEYQEYVQKYKLGSVSYETLWKKGPDHLPEFRVAALLNGAKTAEGTGPNKKAAEREAAKKALDKLKKQGGNKH